MKDEIEIPPKILHATDRQFANVREYLRDEGHIREDEKLLQYTIGFDIEDVAVIEDVVTQ